MAAFIPGVDLARGYYAEVVRPLVEAAAPGVAHSAALLGSGSEVLGYDTERSTDHSWGPRLFVFFEPDDLARYGSSISELLEQRVPETYAGWATRFVPVDGMPVSLRIELVDPARWFEERLGFDPEAGVTVFDWLSTPTQLLLGVTAGEVFHDGLGALAPRRDALAWYPHDVWLYVIGCQWTRIAQEEPFIGRSAEVGDDLGSRIVAARLARDLMRLCFLLERRYAPYSKWLGHAFDTLACSGEIGPHLARALAARSWQRREAEIGTASELIGARHNELGITEAVDATVRQFFGRPFLVLDSQRFATAAFDAIRDPEVAALPRGVGAIDQWADSTDVLSAPQLTRRAAARVFGT
jgi:hypothetical protein